jgi:hypothetical protein
MASDLTYHRLKYSSLVWVALAFGIFAIVGFYSARMTGDYPDYDHGRAEQRKVTLAKVEHDENAQLNPVDDKGNPTAVWVDQDKGVIQIPIGEAMTHELVDLKNEPLGPGAMVPGAAAPAPPAPAPAPATNAAPAKPGAPAATNAAPAKPAAPPAPAVKPQKKKPVKTAPATPNA